MGIPEGGFSTAEKANSAPKESLYSSSSKQIQQKQSHTHKKAGRALCGAAAGDSAIRSLSTGCVGAGTLISDSRRSLVFSFMLDS